jgi:hypothetical protein
MSFHVALIMVINSTLAWAAAELGVGPVERSIALPIRIRRLVSVSRMRRIIMIPFAVRRKLDSSRRTIVAGGIVATAQKDGSSIECPITHAGAANLFLHRDF